MKQENAKDRNTNKMKLNKKIKYSQARMTTKIMKMMDG